MGKFSKSQLADIKNQIKEKEKEEENNELIKKSPTKRQQLREIKKNLDSQAVEEISFKANFSIGDTVSYTHFNKSGIGIVVDITENSTMRNSYVTIVNASGPVNVRIMDVSKI